MLQPPPSAARSGLIGFAAALALATAAAPAGAEALLLVEAASGKVLHAENATYPWYPASVTKLMTAYVTLKAVKERRITLDSLFTVSTNAEAQQPSKMGFKTGTQVTVDNALKMLMVKSANDMAVTLAEGVSGSIESFAIEMNRASQRLGMTQSSWVNPNGLPADEQITSARDMAILARALIREFPEYELYWRIPAIKVGKKVLRNYNMMIDRYPGADGMKTGFICASGFNLVASATRDGKRLIAVVFGAPSGPIRAEKAAQLFEKGFGGGGLSWLLPQLGSVDGLQPIAAAPPNLREEMCGKNRRRPAADSDEGEAAGNGGAADGDSILAVMAQGTQGRPRQGSLLGPLTPSMPPIPVFTGPARKKGDAPAEVAQPKKPDPKARTAAAAPAIPAAAPAAAPVTAGKPVPVPRPRPKR